MDAAAEEFARVQADLGPLLAQDEQAQIDAMQDGFVNFYADDAVTPYVALAARGPWVVTPEGRGAVRRRGYGMLGFGHPDAVLEAMARPQVMANIMTPSLSQQRFITALRAEIGHRRGGCPFARFMCLNSGSEAVGLAARIADVNAAADRPGRAPRTPRSSAWWSRAASMAVPTALPCIPIPAARATCSTWPATAARIR